jgi:2-oxoacid dehydrogenases acyltransferase (catalytic domain)
LSRPLGSWPRAVRPARQAGRLSGRHRIRVGRRCGRWLERAAPVATHIPGTVQAMYAVMARSVAVRQRIGTVAVTAVGMFAGGGGFGLTPMTMMSLEVVIGGMTQRPRVVDGQIEARDVLDLTVVIDHNVVDGAPATRFAAQLRELIETAAVISSSDQAAT